ncbi:MAG: flagellar hook protein FlgE [Gammaproteobacteria bacterium]|nr:flagellar hook protein FlgE [Gammaproteobacteria bacterium]MBQ0839507.1 flagellar hook protein FlgE [Gammaproteobacteria bacterium]
MGFETAVSGIRAASSQLGIIGNNIANSSTSGFKQARGEFADVFASSALGVASNSIGRGVELSAIAQQFTQGNISFTDSSLDLAISGTGFFMLDDGGTTRFTRSGAFAVDSEGFVTNNEGLRLQAFSADAAGQITGLVDDVRLTTSQIEPIPTADVDITANLDSREGAPLLPFAAPFDAFAAPPTAPSADMFNGSTSLTIYDSLGNPHALTTYFVKTAVPNVWDSHVTVDGVTPGGVAAPQTLTFGSTGQFPAASLPVEVAVANWNPVDSSGNPTGAVTPESFTVNLSSTTQFGSDFGVSFISQNGFSSGQLRGVEISDTGVIFARYTNGQSFALGQVALANFANQQGLQPLGSTAWAETFASGVATVSEPGTAGLGLIQSGALEDSNVDITQQLVNMITAQRNFQANAQVIQTEDTVTQTVINLR